MATVKGDVHDIGKNIVGVVLGCNDYEVIDLGVMVPWPRILETAKEQGADLIGLSGLITPSLEEMRTVATEMERAGFQVPLLIGGATTSRAHTAVRIEPAYSGPVVHVIDASRAVGVARALLDPAQHDAFVARTREEYEAVRTAHEGRDRKEARLTLAEARDAPAAHRLDRRRRRRHRPSSAPRAILDQPLEELVERIDWSPFFTTWELAGQYPRILSDPVVGKAATELFRDAQRLLDRIVAERLLHANAVVGFWPAAVDPGRRHRGLRGRDTQLGRGALPHPPPADGEDERPARTWRSPTTRRPSGPASRDHVGLFAVTAGIGLEELRARFMADHDDYGSILAAALADRLAEAFAELLHERVRRELWGYAPDEALDNDALIAERYQGIRPAPGYPSCPDHTEKRTIFDLLDAERAAGIKLTGVDGDAAGGVGQRLLLLAPGGALLRPRAHRPRPARGLRAAQGLVRGGGRALAGAQPHGRDPGLMAQRRDRGHAGRR